MVEKLLVQTEEKTLEKRVKALYSEQRINPVDAVKRPVLIQLSKK